MRMFAMGVITINGIVILTDCTHTSDENTNNRIFKLNRNCSVFTHNLRSLGSNLVENCLLNQFDDSISFDNIANEGVERLSSYCNNHRPDGSSGIIFAGYNSNNKGILKAWFYNHGNITVNDFDTVVQSFPNPIGIFFITKLYDFNIPLEHAIKMCLYIWAETKSIIKMDMDDFVAIATINTKYGTNFLKEDGISEFISNMQLKHREIHKLCYDLFTK